MSKIDTLRNDNGQPAIFLRYGEKAGELVIGIDGNEITMSRDSWLSLPIWQPGLPKEKDGPDTAVPQ